MAPATTKTIKKFKEKVFHPSSRKAGQMERAQLRKSKLENADRKKSRNQSAELDKYVFFYHAMSPEQDCMTLEELHSVVRDVWLARHDSDLEKERSARRPGRPKSAKEMKLEGIIEREKEEYRAGIEVPDLTHAPTVEIFKRWDQTQVAFIQLLRFIRISSEKPTMAVVTRPGKHKSITDSIEPSSNENQDMIIE